MMRSTKAIALSSLVAALLGCQEPTQVRLNIWTDVPYDNGRTIAITAAPLAKLSGAEPEVVVDKPWDERGEVGTLVLVPKDDRSTAIGVLVVLGVSRDPTLCSWDDADGCIVARRRLRFLEHRSVELPVGLFAACEGVQCSESETCNALGECVPADVNPVLCTEPGKDGCFPLNDGLPDGVINAGLDAGDGDASVDANDGDVPDAGVDAGDAGDADDAAVVGPWEPTDTLEASQREPGDQFGWNVALSEDGSTLAVGARFESSAATGVDGDEASNAASKSGAVYVFVRSGGTWVQQAYLKASNTGAGDWFGHSVALSADGDTLAVGSSNEDSAATGVNGNEASNAASSSGATYVFVRSSGQWEQQAYLKASNTNAADRFGDAVVLSADGDTLAVGAWEDSAATGVNGDESNNDADRSGAVYVFGRSGGAWTQQAYLKASNTGAMDEFGDHIALSADGSTLVACADQEDSAATGVNGDEANDDATDSGAVYIFAQNGGEWTQEAYLKASSTGAGDNFGERVAISADGSVVAISAYLEDSAATGVNGDENNDDAEDSGAAYIFVRSAGVWAQEAYLKASNTESDDTFGKGLALSADGRTVAVGADGEDSSASGVDGEQTNGLNLSGAAYVFERGAGVWTQQAYIKASISAEGARFGQHLTLSGDARTLAVGAYAQDAGTGAVYLFDRW